LISSKGGQQLTSLHLRPYVATDIQQRLQHVGPPACYLDFEAMMPPIPLYEGTHPYQTLPFQWSLHSWNSYGTLRHQKFLADGASDPRREFAETLIDTLAASDYPVIVYSGYERRQLMALAIPAPPAAPVDDCAEDVKNERLNVGEGLHGAAVYCKRSMILSSTARTQASSGLLPGAPEAPIAPIILLRT
jgi:hypothetical protein